MSKFLNEGDFFMCTGGMMPAKMKSGQVTTGKKSAVKYIRITDVQTTSFGDFVCKKLMLLMAVAAVLFALLCAVTGGAALIAAAAIGGAVGAAAGALICGTKAAAARKWLIPKQQVYINGQLALTDGSYMTCTAVGTEQIRLAPHIKNWWQAMAVGVTNFAGEMFKCVMVGAAAAGGIALLTEGVGAFLSNAAANYLLTWTSGWGLALRGTIGVMGAVQSKYVGGDSTGDAILHGVQGSTYGMEQGTAQSMGNIATGQGKPEDYAALLAWGAPIAPEANKGPIDADAMGNPWEGKPQSGKTGFLESERMSRSELQEYKQGLNDQGVDFQIDKKGVLPDNARAGFDPNNGKVYLRKGATNYEAFHEAQHAKQWGELGKDAYLKQSRAEREQYVYDQIMKNKGQFSDAELKHARDYINDVRSKEGMPPVLDAVEGGTPKKGEDGDLFEDPMAVKEQEKAKAEESRAALLKRLRRERAANFYRKYKPDIKDKELDSHLNGIDFSKPVKIVKIPPGGGGPEGNTLYQFTKVNSEGKSYRGEYFTPDENVTAPELGVSDKYDVRDANDRSKYTGTIKTVEQQTVTIPADKPVEGLQSVANPIKDTWSLNNQEVPTPGGGEQVMVPNTHPNFPKQ